MPRADAVHPFTRPTCKHCGVFIHWTRMVDTKASLPLDPTPGPDGNVRLVRDGRFGEYISVELRRQAAVAAGESLYTPHWATCPKADEWRPEKPR